MTSKIVFFLEEPSAKAMLDGVMPKLLPADISYQCVVFSGKGDLEKRMGKRLRAWLEPDVCFMVVRDQDSGDCREIKQRLSDICSKAGRNNVIVRIACRELESWYLADLSAVEAGLGIRGLARKQGQRKFRHPDGLQSPARELALLTEGKYQKLAGSRAIGPYLDLQNHRSNSFRVFIEGIHRMSAILAERQTGRGNPSGSKANNDHGKPSS
jgi:hypothetical protein